MPNWCATTLTVVGDEQTVVDISRTVHKLEDIIAAPTELSERWYDWNCLNWGTKWDVENPFEWSVGNGEISCNFDTAWGTPVLAAVHLYRKFTPTRVEVMGQEEGNQLLERVVIDAGTVVHECVCNYTCMASDAVLAALAQACPWFDRTQAVEDRDDRMADRGEEGDEGEEEELVQDPFVIQRTSLSLSAYLQQHYEGADPALLPHALL